MKHLSLILSICVAALTACNLTYRSPLAMSAAPIQVEPVMVQPTEVPTAQLPLPCSPRADWPVYAVVAGDTLSSIAVRSNSTVAELAAANCLDNPSLILVRQQLFVLRIPSPVDDASARAW